MSLSVLIPAKSFANAKQRLSSLLSAKQRSLLAEAMLKDVLRQVERVRGLEGIFVVTGDRSVAGIAFSTGTEVIWESEERGETEAVEFALREMKRRGIRVALVVPADIPLVHSSDIEAVVEFVSVRRLIAPFALLVPSHDRLGTNGLLVSPPDLISVRFGYDSFSHHVARVAARGVTPLIMDNERIGLDIDEPQDLERLLSLGPAGETYSALAGMGMSLGRL